MLWNPRTGYSCFCPLSRYDLRGGARLLGEFEGFSYRAGSFTLTVSKIVLSIFQQSGIWILCCNLTKDLLLHDLFTKLANPAGVDHST